MNASLLFHTLLRRSVALVHWTESHNPPPPTAVESDGEHEPEPQPDRPFWTYFIENPRPTSVDRDNNN